MNCTDPVRDTLVEVTDQTVVTSNQAAVAGSPSRDRTAPQVSALELRTSECAKGSNIPENPTPRRATRAGLWLGPRRPAKPVLAGPGVKSVGEPPVTSSQVVGPVEEPRPNCHRKEDDHAAPDCQV
jgi:hypothetical protein